MRPGKEELQSCCLNKSVFKIESTIKKNPGKFNNQPGFSLTNQKTNHEKLNLL